MFNLLMRLLLIELAFRMGRSSHFLKSLGLLVMLSWYTLEIFECLIVSQAYIVSYDFFCLKYFLYAIFEISFACVAQAFMLSSAITPIKLFLKLRIHTAVGHCGFQDSFTIATDTINEGPLFGEFGYQDLQLVFVRNLIVVRSSYSLVQMSSAGYGFGDDELVTRLFFDSEDGKEGQWVERTFSPRKLSQYKYSTNRPQSSSKENSLSKENSYGGSHMFC